ncbi:Conserved_hypothetical protein [Hexamita inflata]|uniref:Uncharacterized protein n=1 Tax=Hexamita inflata TaxID=28002 RepID=A0ABP1HHH8_9EUKA
MTLAQILLNSQDSQLVQSAYYQLEQYKQQTEDYLTDVFNLVFNSDPKVSFLASTQLVFLLKKFDNMPQNKVLDITQYLINNYHVMIADTRHHVSQIVSSMAASLFFTKVYDTLPQRIAALISECQDVSLLLDYYVILAKLYLHQAGHELNDNLAFQLKLLLDHTQHIPLYVSSLIQNQSAREQILLTLYTAQIFQSAYSWEDLPDYFEDNLQNILSFLVLVLQKTGTSRFELQTEEACVDVFVNVIIRHFELVPTFQLQLIQTLLDFVEQKNADTREFAVARIIQQTSQWMESPELGQFIQTNFTEKLFNISIAVLQFTEKDAENAECFDQQFVSSYILSRDTQSRVYAAENMLRAIRRYQPSAEVQMQEFVQQNAINDFFRALQVFRVLVVQSQSQTLGLQIQPGSQAVINQMIPVVWDKFTKLAQQPTLYQGEILKFFFDFFDYIPQEQLDQFLANIPESVYENQFTATVLAQGFKQVLNSKIIKNNQIKTPDTFVLKMINCSQLYMFQNETCCQACCALIKACNSPQYFEPALNVMIQLLKDSKVQQSTMAFANLLAEQVSLVDDETKIKFVSALIEQFQTLSDQVLDDALVFILQLLAICSRVCVHPCFNVVMNAAITQESHESDLTQALFLFVDNYICTPQFVNGTYTPTNLRLQEAQSTQINQSSQLIKLLTELIQKPTVAAHAYQTLNLLLRCNIDLDTTLLTQIVSYNSERASSLYTNRTLLKQITIFYCSLFNKFDQVQMATIFAQANTQFFAVMNQIVIIGCQSSFSIKDKKAFLCTGLLKISNEKQLKPVFTAIGNLFGKFRNRQSFVTNEKVNQEVNFCSVVGIENYLIDEEDPKDLDQQCLGALGQQSWR